MVYGMYELTEEEIGIVEGQSQGVTQQATWSHQLSSADKIKRTCLLSKSFIIFNLITFSIWLRRGLNKSHVAKYEICAFPEEPGCSFGHVTSWPILWRFPISYLFSKQGSSINNLFTFGSLFNNKSFNADLRGWFFKAEVFLLARTDYIACFHH